MKLTKRLTALSLAAALCLGMAACGGKKDPDPAGSTPPEGPAPAQTTPKPPRNYSGGGAN